MTLNLVELTTGVAITNIPLWIATKFGMETWSYIEQQAPLITNSLERGEIDLSTALIGLGLGGTAIYAGIGIELLKGIYEDQFSRK